MKKRFFIPMALVMSMMMAVPAFAQHIFIGDTETVVSYDENGNKVITLIFDPAKTPDYMNPDSPNYWRKAEQAQMEQTTNIPVLPQAGQNAGITAQPEEETLFQPILPLTEAPEVGTVLANIQQEDENGEMKFTEPYHWCAVGQCTWYANGRFYEVTGIRLPLLGNAKEWLNTAQHYEYLQIDTDTTNVPEQAIAVYVPKKNTDLPGHVCFIEYVERDNNGKPQNIYYTDANGKYDKVKNEYTSGYDGAVVKEDFDTFKESNQLKLAGYIKAKK